MRARARARAPGCERNPIFTPAPCKGSRGTDCREKPGILFLPTVPGRAVTATTGRHSGMEECKQGKTSETLISGHLVGKGGTEMVDDWAGRRQEGRLGLFIFTPAVV